MFKPVSPKLNVNEMEEGILKFWKDEDIFKRSTENRKGGREYVFYEGPPTANYNYTEKRAGPPTFGEFIGFMRTETAGRKNDLSRTADRVLSTGQRRDLPGFLRRNSAIRFCC